MNTHWTERQKIHTYEVDSANRLRTSAIFGFMQEAASNSASELGWGYDELIKDGLFWVLSRIKIVISEYKHVGEDILVETWPKQVEGIVAHRDFKIQDIGGSVIGLATSSWFLIDANTLRPVKTDVLKRKIPHFGEEPALAESLAKIMEPSEKIWKYKREIRYSDIDIIQHVNNTKYVDFIMDSFPIEVHQEKKLSSLQINFVNELKFGDQLDVYQAVQRDDESKVYVDGLNQSGKKIFQAEVCWQ